MDSMKFPIKTMAQRPTLVEVNPALDLAYQEAQRQTVAIEEVNAASVADSNRKAGERA
jgi:hypothetical protein